MGKSKYAYSLMEDYGDTIVFMYDSESGRYTLHDNLIGNTLGEAVLHDGPGWVFVMKECRSLMQDELAEVLSFIEDLNAELSDDVLNRKGMNV